MSTMSARTAGLGCRQSAGKHCASSTSRFYFWPHCVHTPFVQHKSPPFMHRSFSNCIPWFGSDDSRQKHVPLREIWVQNLMKTHRKPPECLQMVKMQTPKWLHHDLFHHWKKQIELLDKNSLWRGKEVMLYLHPSAVRPGGGGYCW
jgi:hypothetical protein